MFENRIGHLIAAPLGTAESFDLMPSFIPCPMPLFAAIGSYQQAFIAEIYRRAHGLAEAQLIAERRSWRMPEFSLN